MLSKQDVGDIQLENRRLRQRHEAAVMSISQALIQAKESLSKAQKENKSGWLGIIKGYENSLELLNR